MKIIAGFPTITKKGVMLRSLNISTHKNIFIDFGDVPLDFSHNLLLNDYAVSVANSNGFTINLSGNTLEHADQLVDADCGPVVSVLPIEYERQTKRTDAGKAWAETEPEYKVRLRTLPQTTPQGRRVVVCPATYKDNTACVDCQLCQKANRKAIVGFPAHGRSKRKADTIARGGQL